MTPASHPIPPDPIPPYPADFHWGVSTAAYQVEGGLNGAGEPRNNWAAWEDAARVERTGRSVGFWDRWHEDLDLARSLGVTAFRLGLEWARIEPRPDASAPAALDRYADILAGARRRGLEPVVTLQHFTHPEWLGPDPWLDPATPARFAAYARATATALNRRLAERGEGPVRFWVTINEPNALAIATYLLRAFPRGPRRGGKKDLSRALATLMQAHLLAYRAITDLYAETGAPSPTITYNAWASSAYAADRYLVDLLRPATRRHTRELARAFDRALGPLGLKNRLARFLVNRSVDPAAFAPLLAELGPDEDPLPALALDYYHPFLGDYLGLTGPRRHPWEWPLDAARMPTFLGAWLGPHTDRRLHILEHGLGTRPTPHRGRHRPDALARPAAIAAAIVALDRSLAAGLPIASYFHWSLIDNYEWGSFTPRFGLFAVDHDDDARRLPHDATGADAAGAYRDLIRDRRP